MMLQQASGIISCAGWCPACWARQVVAPARHVLHMQLTLRATGTTGCSSKDAVRGGGQARHHLFTPLPRTTHPLTHSSTHPCPIVSAATSGTVGRPCHPTSPHSPADPATCGCSPSPPPHLEVCLVLPQAPGQRAPGRAAVGSRGRGGDGATSRRAARLDHLNDALLDGALHHNAARAASIGRSKQGARACVCVCVHVCVVFRPVQDLKPK